MSEGKLKVGIAGRRGMAFVEAFRALPHVEVSAFCDIDETVRTEMANRHSIPLRYAKFADMLDAVDAVVVATPMPLHVPQSILALHAGKHVLSEVGATVSLEESWRLLDAVRASKALYMMGENYAYFHENVLIKEMVRKGFFGEPYFGEGEYVHEIRQMHHNPDGTPTWRYYWQVGVNGNTYPTHSVGPVMQWFKAWNPDERIDHVVCLGTGRRTDPEHVQEDTTLTLCKTESGKLIKLRLDMLSNRPHTANTYSLQGTTGVYESGRMPGESGKVWIGKSRDGDHREWRPLSDFEEHLPEIRRNPPEAAVKAGHGGTDYFQIRDFVEAIVKGGPSPVDVYSALEWTAVGLCSQISIENGGVPIRVPDFRNLAERPVILDAPPVVP